MLRPLVIISVFALAFAANPTVQWVKAGEADTCAGILVPCTDISSCSAMAMGPCTSAAAGAPNFIASVVQGMAWVDANNYLVASDPAPYAKLIEPEQGYRDYSSETGGEDGSTYAFTMTGAYVSETVNNQQFGGYLGVAHYLNTGATAIKTKYNTVYVAGPSNTARVDRSASGGSDKGAPMGPYTACIGDVTNGACTGERTFNPGAYKFSIFAYSWESAAGAYKNGVAAGIEAGTPEGLPKTTSHLGVRTLLIAYGFNPTAITFNNGAYADVASLGNNDVTSFELQTGNGQEAVIYAFPQEFNYGKLDNPQTDGTPVEVTGTSTLKVKVSAAPDIEGRKAIYVDYLFAMDKIDEANEYFIYDPSVASRDKDGKVSDPSVLEKATTYAETYASSNGNADGDGGDGGLGAGAIAGIAVGVALAIALGVFAKLKMSKKKKAAAGEPKKAAGESAGAV